ncbi:MAG: hypothetical protein L3J36_01850 [Rhodobacteraceae bacterium]|nr:hypothetical protein [Paracoccaceae bacterium]
MNGNNCKTTCWLLALAAGCLIGLFFWIGAEWSLFWSFIAGVIVCVMSAVFLPRFFCSDEPAATNSSATVSPAAMAEPTATHPTPPAEPETASEPEPHTAAQPEPVSIPGEPVAPEASAIEGAQPEGLSTARSGGADNLKLIKGVGPKLEGVLNSLGFFHFDQIAGWGASDVAWVDENLLGFKGRVSRDNWVAQAKALAAGEETEFAKRAKTDGIYD